MNRIKEVLESKGIKQIWLAERLEKSYNMVNSYVQNRRQPSLEDLFKIAKILDVAVAELLETHTSKKTYDSSMQSTNLKVAEGEEEYEKMINIPVLGNVACGYPLFAEENIETEISISTKLIRKNKKYFILRASGDSMNKANIDDGDLVLIRKEQTAEDGDRVVALIDDEATIKEFKNNLDHIVLLPKSTTKEHQPIILTRDFKIQGIVESIIKI
ncbi:transcriptional repressor LexA [Wocania ichthyoenteri]|uniref:transcriptional repressor LexA n=1 Tax=Wocania ichthyoenteri TaxID=1230531 RepID=UPI0009DD689A|nr:transcriptional repressor LexA [Wocania ichthyoenteri]